MKKVKKIKGKGDIDFHDEATFFILTLGTLCILLAVYLILTPITR